jgi:hypothetical protein
MVGRRWEKHFQRFFGIFEVLAYEPDYYSAGLWKGCTLLAADRRRVADDETSYGSLSTRPSAGLSWRIETSRFLDRWRTV